MPRTPITTSFTPRTPVNTTWNNDSRINPLTCDTTLYTCDSTIITCDITDFLLSWIRWQKRTTINTSWS